MQQPVPFLRLLPPLAIGIGLEWALQLSSVLIWVQAAVASIWIILYIFLSVPQQYRLRIINGLAFFLLFAALGMWLVRQQDVRLHTRWVGRMNSDTSCITATLEAPPVERPRSFKVLARIDAIRTQGGFQPAEGHIFIYLKKGHAPPECGSRLVFRKTLQPVANTGNPGAFDFRRYCLFNGITHQVFLSDEDLVWLTGREHQTLRDCIFRCQTYIVSVLRRFIPGSREQGLAEALLIGYRNDLDPELVQAYTNTGVVHIIAISGMHLALIYGLMLLLTRPLKRKGFNWLRVLLLVSGLWLFSLVAGAQASVVRATVIFTCMALGELLNRKTSSFNSLLLSAFFLLCYDPFWLWDAGFQLSYAAVLGIMLLYRRIYVLCWMPNKLLDGIWQTIAVSLAAQVFTTPVSLYQFHQFPLLFLLTNLVAVPLSGIIVFAEIAVCGLSVCAPAAHCAGWCTSVMIRWLNGYIARLDQTSFALWEGFQLNTVQLFLLLLAVSCITAWIIHRKKILVFGALTALFLAAGLRAYSFFQCAQQRRIVIYNIPHHDAIDLVAGRTYMALADTALAHDEAAWRFYIQPARSLFRLRERLPAPRSPDLVFCGRRIVILESASRLDLSRPIDLLVLTGAAAAAAPERMRNVKIGRVVASSSLSPGRTKHWKAICDTARIPFYTVVDSGAFVMKL